MFRVSDLAFPEGVIALTRVSAEAIGEGLVGLRCKIAGRKKKAPRKT